MPDHVVTVGAVQRDTRSPDYRGGSVPAFAYSCSCGARGLHRVAIGITTKARNEALEQARVGGIQHQREANRRPLESKRQARAGNVVDLRRIDVPPDAVA